MRYNYGFLILLIGLCLLSIIISSCKTSKSNCDAYGILWKNPRIDSLSVIKDDMTYLPFVPVGNAKEFHMDNPNSGRYCILLKSGNKIIERRAFVLK